MADETWMRGEGDGPWSDEERPIELPLIVTLLRVTGEEAADPSITCPECGMTSHHPEDVRHRYCGRCHQFHNEIG